MAAGGAGEAWVEVLQTHDMAELGLAKSVLASADLPFVVEGESSLGLFPLTTPGFFGKRGLGAVLRVRREDEEEARALLAEVGTEGEVAGGGEDESER